ncbi:MULTISPECIES: DUF4174 domain-containing protein [unclassified Guyparkeria]|uniref:DUF4174 domain-containing protein n=1 Tax=unclassified Guyparkeria TaxID=2626246 RepID=UPI0007337312|nr:MULTISPECIES: DUF4174 domain-containing protein [unclassified Guyparkeria]KTG16132.1 hypothetical protein AUR63_04645 [Guyparkeria sp. XI15]OAE84983.1 hypothetical protein AWR35_04655 [Guyparkeria sp. WRN-7]
MPVPAPLFLAVALFSGNAPANAEPAGNPGYWQALEWQHRPLLMVIGTGNRAAARGRQWEDRLLASRCALAERRIHWLEVRPGGVWRRFAGDEEAQFERTRLTDAAEAVVRQRVRRKPDGSARLLLFGLDGERKYVGQPSSLEPILALIDRMPMRRAELEREPDDCPPR